MKKTLLFFILFLSCFFNIKITYAKANVLNVYVWTAYVPHAVVKQFEKETGIRVNLSEYDSNETMYAKLKTSSTAGYDVIFPSNYLLERLRQQDMLRKLDKDELPNFKNLNPDLLHKPFDPENHYSIPYLWGVTGIAVNPDYFDPNTITKWSDLWQPRFRNHLLILDDMREVFSVALLALGYSVNDANPAHIKEAYFKLKELMPNIKIFNSDVEQSIYIDEDAVIGMAWNGDFNLSRAENKKLKFIYPKDGFVLWIDCVAITKNAPHLANAYKFLNFLLKPEIAQKVSTEIGFASANLASIKLLPKELQDDPVMNPDKATFKRAELQNNADTLLPMYEKYWELLKLGS